MDGGRAAAEEREAPWTQQEGLLQSAEGPSSSMHEQGFLALLDRFCQLETGLEEALRGERLAREAGAAELRELLDAERQAREIGSDSLQELIAKEIYAQKAEIKDRIREEMILEGRLNGKRHMSPRDNPLGNEDGSGKVQELLDSTSSMQERIAELETQLGQEQDSRKADVEELRRLLGSERHAGGDKLESVDNFKDLLEKEQEARELHLSSVQDLLSLESQARQAHARELQTQLAAEGSARERLREEFQVVLEDGLLQQHAALEEQVARLERLLAEASTQPPPSGGTSEAGAGLEDRLSKLEKRFEEELRELGDAVGGTKLSQEEHASSVKEAMAKEERARMLHLGSVQDLLTEESGARQVHIEMFKEHLGAERACRERQQAALAERLGLLEASAREAAGRQAAELANRTEDLQAHAISLHDSLQQQLARHREEVHGHSCELKAHSVSLQESLQQQLACHREELVGHGRELQVQLAAQLEEVHSALHSHREEVLAHGTRHDALCDRLAALEGQGIEGLGGGGSPSAVQQLYEHHRQGLLEHVQEHVHERAREWMQQLEGHRDEIEAKHRSLEVCVAQEQNSRELYENLIGDQLRKEKLARDQQLESLAARIEQEREQREKHLAGVHDAIRQERSHREAFHGSHQDEQATLERACEQLRELRSGEGEGSAVAARLAAVERTLTVISNLIRTEQTDREKELQRVWDVLDHQAHGHRKPASNPAPQHTPRSSHALGHQAVHSSARESLGHQAAHSSARESLGHQAAHSSARERAGSPVWMWNNVGTLDASSPSLLRGSSPPAARQQSPLRGSSPPPARQQSPPREPPETGRMHMSTLAQRSSAALIEATAKTLGSSLTLPLASPAGSCRTPQASVPERRMLPGASTPSLFAAVARAPAGIGPGPPVAAPSPAWMPQSLGPRGAYGPRSLVGPGAAEQPYALPTTMYAQDPEELAI